MVKRKLTVIKINEDYDVQLLDELARQATVPLNDLFEYLGVKQDRENIEFDPPLKSHQGLALWTVDLIRKSLEHKYSENILAVMPHPIGIYPEFSGGWGKERVAFLSTYQSYLNTLNHRRFLRYARKAAAHELGHLFGLEHHERRTYTPSGLYCLMYTRNATDMRAFLDSLDMQFCGSCYRRLHDENIRITIL